MPSSSPPSEGGSTSLYFTPLKFHQTLLRPYAVLARRPTLFLLLGAFLELPLMAVMAGSVHALQSSWTPGQVDLVAWAEAHAKTVAQVAVLLALVYLTVGIAVQAAILRAVAEVYVGKVPTFRTNLRAGFSKIGPILCYSLAWWFGWLVLAIAVMIVVGAVLALLTVLGVSHSTLAVISFLMHVGLVVAAIIMSLMLYVVVPAIVTEGQTWMQAIQRSYLLTKGNLCFLFWAIFVYFLLMQFILTAYWYILVGFWDATDLLSVHGVVLMILPDFFFVPLTIILNAILYIHLRVVKDGCNRSVLATELYGDNNEALYAPILPEESDSDDDVEAQAPTVDEVEGEYQAPAIVSNGETGVAAAALPEQEPADVKVVTNEDAAEEKAPEAETSTV